MTSRRATRETRHWTIARRATPRLRKILLAESLVRVAVVMLLSVVPALGQSVAPPQDRYRYPLPTYDEDWHHFRGSEHHDRWDTVKFIPLSPDATAWLSLGGEARVTYERFGNQNFGLTARDPNGYLLQRYMFHTDVRLGSHICSTASSSRRPFMARQP